MENIDKELLQEILYSSGLVLLKIVGAILGVIIALYAIKAIVKLIVKLLNLAQVHKLDAKLNEIEIVDGKKLNFDSVKVISTFIKYALYVILLMVGSNILGLEVISKPIEDLIGYMPKLVTGIIIFMIGLLLANTVKNALKSLFESMDISGGKLISQLVFFLILIFMSITALNQAEIDTQIITQNLTLIIGAVLLAFAIAFGLGAKEVVGKLLKTFYARKTFEIGQKIVFNDEVYTIEALENILVTLKNSKGKVIVPINDLVDNQVHMQD